MSEIESFAAEFATEQQTELQPAENAEVSHVDETATTADPEETPKVETEEKAETEGEYKERTRKQFEKLRLERLQAKKEADDLRAQLNELSATKELTDVEQLDKYIDQRAEQRIKERQTAEKIDRTYKEGIKNISTFQESLNNLQMVGVGDDLMEAILDAGDNSAVIIDFLGQNPDIAEQIKALSPVQMGRQLAYIENQIAERKPKGEPKEAKVSKVPEPIKPLTSSGKTAKEPSPDDEDLTEWFALQRKKRTR